MKRIVIEVSSANRNGRPLDSAEVAQWVAESLNNKDTRNSGDMIVVHSLVVEDEDA